jgi:hypothetical protein
MVLCYIVLFIINTQTLSYFVCSIDNLTSMVIMTVTHCCCDMNRLSVSQAFKAESVRLLDA